VLFPGSELPQIHAVEPQLWFVRRRGWSDVRRAMIVMSIGGVRCNVGAGAPNNLLRQPAGYLPIADIPIFVSRKVRRTGVTLATHRTFLLWYIGQARKGRPRSSERSCLLRNWKARLPVHCEEGATHALSSDILGMKTVHYFLSCTTISLRYSNSTVHANTSRNPDYILRALFCID
jgi:hypothetical protein